MSLSHETNAAQGTMPSGRVEIPAWFFPGLFAVAAVLVVVAMGSSEVSSENSISDTESGTSSDPRENAPDCNNPNGHVMWHTTTYDVNTGVTTTLWHCWYCTFKYTITS